MSPPVLVVEDDAVIRQTLREILEDEGYVVYEAPDGRPALARLRESKESLVVLLDLNMPGMNGRKVLEAVAAHNALAARHAYVLLTANGPTLPLSLAHLLTLLHVPVLPMPFDLDDLLAAVMRATARLT